MLDQPVTFDTLLRRIDNLERELERLRRDMLSSLPVNSETAVDKPSLFGSVSGDDITDELIRDAQQRLFRKLDDL